MKQITYNKIIQKVIKKYNIELIDVNLDRDYIIKSDSKIEDYINSSYIIGNDTIILGIYKNQEKRLISFFHEIGHILVKEIFKKSVGYKSLPIEMQAWQEGLMLAGKMKVNFTDNIIAWGYTRALSYKNYK